MKTLTKPGLFVLASIAIVAVACKGKSGTASASASDSPDIVASAKGTTVMDSLNITDPDEKKVCALYDDAVTDYLKVIKTIGTDTSKPATAQKAALDKEYQAKQNEIKPQVEAMQRKIAMNPSEAMKFSQFSVYESKRLMGVMAAYTRGLMKYYPTATPATK